MSSGKGLNNYKIINGVSVLAILLLLVAMFSNFVYDAEKLTLFFSSDALYLPSIYKDLFIDGNKFKYWHLNPAPNYFPDMIVYFMLMFVTKNFIASSFIFSILQYIGLGFLFVTIFRLVFPGRSAYYNALIYGLLCTILLEVFFYTKGFTYLFNLIVSAYHTGAFVITLLCFVFTCRYILEPKKIWLLLLFVTGFAMVLSDQLFIVLFPAPMLITLTCLCRKLGLRKSGLLAATILVFSVAGMIVHKQIDTEPYDFLGGAGTPVDVDIIVSQFGIFFSQVYDYLTAFGFRALSLYLFILSSIGMIFVFLHALRRPVAILIPFYALLSLVFSVCVICAPMLSGKYIGGDCLRYNIYPFYLGFLNIVVLIAYAVKNPLLLKAGRHVVLGMTFLLIIVAFTEMKPAGLKEFFTYYPEPVKQLDAIAQTEDLKAGAANFWDAKKITMFSKKGLKVYPVFDDVAFYQHAASDGWFFKNEFNFVVVSGFSDTTLYKEKLKDIRVIGNTAAIKVVKTHPFHYVTYTGSTAINKE